MRLWPHYSTGKLAFFSCWHEVCLELSRAKVKLVKPIEIAMIQFAVDVHDPTFSHWQMGF